MAQKDDRWSKRETQKLKKKWSDNMAEEISNMLPGRTVEAVESKAQRLREKGKLPEKNRSSASSSSSYSTPQSQVEKGGSRMRDLGGEVTEWKWAAPNGTTHSQSDTIALKIGGDWYYINYTPSRFTEMSGQEAEVWEAERGVELEPGTFSFDLGTEAVPVEGAHIMGGDYSVEEDRYGDEYRWVHSLGSIEW